MRRDLLAHRASDPAGSGSSGSSSSPGPVWSRGPSPRSGVRGRSWEVRRRTGQGVWARKARPVGVSAELPASDHAPTAPAGTVTSGGDQRGRGVALGGAEPGLLGDQQHVALGRDQHLGDDAERADPAAPTATTATAGDGTASEDHQVGPAGHPTQHRTRVPTQHRHGDPQVVLGQARAHRRSHLLHPLPAEGVLVAPVGVGGVAQVGLPTLLVARRGDVHQLQVGAAAHRLGARPGEQAGRRVEAEPHHHPGSTTGAVPGAARGLLHAGHLLPRTSMREPTKDRHTPGAWGGLL